MISFRLFSILLCIIFCNYAALGQCTSGCSTIFSSGGSINPTSNNQVICITGAGSYTYTSAYSNIHVKVCAADVTISQFSINSASALNNKIETWAANTTVSNVNVTADTFQLISHSTNTRLTSGNFNRKAKFITTDGADISISGNLNPGDKVFFDIAANSSITTADVTSNKGGQIYVGKGGSFTSTGTVTFQNDGELFNKGNVNIANQLTIQGGANALNNYCGNSAITVGGDFIVNTGVINNGGTIKTERILINANSGPIYMKQGSYIEANRLANMDQVNIFRGDSIDDGQCATFRLNTSFNSWNQPLTNSSKINYCGITAPAGRLGTATIGCACTSVLIGCDLVCKKPEAGTDAVFCTPLPTIDLTDATNDQVWTPVTGNPASATINQNSGLVSGMTVGGVYRFVLTDTIGPDNPVCTDTISLTVVPKPLDNLVISGGVFCSDAVNGIVTIANAQPNVTYTAKIGTTTIGSGMITGNASADLVINIPMSSLSNGSSVVNVTASIAGCSDVALLDTAQIIKNPKPSGSLTATGGKFCSTETNVSVQIQNAEPGVTYNALLGGVQIGTAKNTNSASGNLTISIPLSSLTTGLNTVNFEALIPGCAKVILSDTAGVSIVPNPSNSLVITGNTVCSNQTETTVTIENAEPNVVYTALKGTNILGSNSRSTTGDLDIVISTSLLSVGNNTINVEANINGCAKVAILDTTNVNVVPNPSSSLTATGGIFCSTETNANVQIQNAEPGVTYNALFGGTLVGTATNTAFVVGNLNITIPLSLLTTGLNAINFEALIPGCAKVILSDTAGVSIVPNPSNSLIASGNTVCSNQTETTVTIENAEPNVVYTALLGTTVLGNNTRSTVGDLEILVPTSSLINGNNTINIEADIFGCAKVAILDTANVNIVPNPSAALTASGGIFCSTETNAKVQIQNAEPGVTYNALLGGIQIGTATNSTSVVGNLDIIIPLSSLTTGFNVIHFEAIIPGCANVDLTDTAGIVIVPNPSSDLTVLGNIICSSSGSSTSILIQSALPNVSYSAYNGSVLLGSDMLSGSVADDLIIEISTSLLLDGDNIISVKADIYGCATVDLQDTANVILDPALSPGTIIVENPLVCASNSPVLLNENPPIGGLIPLTYNWEYSTDGTNWVEIVGSNTSDNVPGVPAISVNTQYRRNVKSKLCTAVSTAVTANVISTMNGGSISAIDPNVCESDIPSKIESLTPATGGTGSLMEYQWQSSSDGISWSTILSALNLDYEPLVQTENTYYRRRAVNGNSTCDTSYAGPVLISVYEEFVSGEIQSGDTIVCDGSDLIVKSKIPAGGGSPGITYLWQESIAPFNDWTDVLSSNAENLNVTSINQTTRYRRIAINTCDQDTTTGFYEVKVLPNEVSDVQLENIPGILCDIDTISLSAQTSGAGSGRSISWFINEELFTASIAYPDSVFVKQGNWQNGDKIKVVVTAEPGKLCTTPSDSTEITLEVNYSISGNNLSGDMQKACSIAELKSIEGLAASGTLANPPYIWQISSDSIQWNDIADATSQNYLPEITTGVFYYRRIAVSAGACANDTSSSSIEIRLDGDFDPGIISLEQDKLCQGSIPVFNVNSPIGGVKPYTYQWESSSDSLLWVPIDFATDSIYISPAINGSTYYRRIVYTGTDFCTYNSNVVHVHVDTAVVTSTNTIGSDQAICEGMIPQLLEGSQPQGGVKPLQYKWISSSDGISGWVDVANSEGQDFQPDTLTQTTFYKRVVTSTGACSNDTSASAVKVYVDPKITSGQVVASVGSVCQLSVVEVCGTGFTGGSPEITLQWQQSIDDINWTDLVGQTNDTLFAGPLTRSTNFRLIVTSGLTICKDTSNTRKIVVNNPVTPGSNTIPSGQDICLGSLANPIIGSVPQGGLINVKYQWMSSPNGIDNWTVLTDSTRKDLIPGSPVETIYYKRIVTSTGACSNDTTAGVYELFVDTPVVPGKLGEDQQFCEKDTLFLDHVFPANGGTSLAYTWQIAEDTINPVWQAIPNHNIAETFILKEDLPDFEVFYFRRIANSKVCSATSDVLGVYPCLNPELWNGFPDSLCLNESLTDSIVTQIDKSRNGGGLVPLSTPVFYPNHGQITFIDTVNKVFTYEPTPGFYGLDSIGFRVCDTSQFRRCADKKIYITVLYTNNGLNVYNDYYTEYRNTTISGNLLTNDSDPDGDTLYVVDPVVELPKNGTVSVNYDGSFQYLPYNSFTGRDSLIVNICDFSSMKRCSQSICLPDTLHFNILPNRVFVPDGFSPNNDNIHDVFVIKTDAPSEIQFMVYNRWGNLVYENKKYNNNWDGTANNGLVIGKGVPDGTYYIYYNINDGEFEGFKYITLNR